MAGDFPAIFFERVMFLTLCFNKKRVSTFLFCITFCFVITFNFAVPRKTYAFVIVDDIAAAIVLEQVVQWGLVVLGVTAATVAGVEGGNLVNDVISSVDVEELKKELKQNVKTATATVGDVTNECYVASTDFLNKILDIIRDYLSANDAVIQENFVSDGVDGVGSYVNSTFVYNGIEYNFHRHSERFSNYAVFELATESGGYFSIVEFEGEVCSGSTPWYYSSGVYYQDFVGDCVISPDFINQGAYISSGVLTYTGDNYSYKVLHKSKYYCEGGELPEKYNLYSYFGRPYLAPVASVVSSNCNFFSIPKYSCFTSVVTPHSLTVGGTTYPLTEGLSDLRTGTTTDLVGDENVFENEDMPVIGIPVGGVISDDLIYYPPDVLGNISTGENVGTGEDVGTGDVVTDAPSTGFDLSDILDFLKKILDAILSIPSAISSAISSGISSILDFLKKILDAILSIPSVILSGIESIFIPRTGFLEDIIDDIKIALDKAFGIGTFDINLIPINEKKFDDMYATINIGSYEFTFKTLDASFLLLALDKFRKYIRAFLYFALFLYNINQFMGLIGQPNLTIGALKGSNETVKGADDE